MDTIPSRARGEGRSDGRERERSVSVSSSDNHTVGLYPSLYVYTSISTDVLLSKPTKGQELEIERHSKALPRHEYRLGVDKGHLAPRLGNFACVDEGFDLRRGLGEEVFSFR